MTVREKLESFTDKQLAYFILFDSRCLSKENQNDDFKLDSIPSLEKWLQSDVNNNYTFHNSMLTKWDKNNNLELKNT